MEPSIKQFMDDEGRLTQLPRKQTPRLAALRYLCGKFTPNTVYTEQEVNVVCGQWHTFGDYFLLRRELVDHGLLTRTRDGSRYERAPETDPPTAPYRFVRLQEADLEDIRTLFTDVFTREPWNDDWSDETQLRLYLLDHIAQPCSLTYGLYNGERLIALSMGRIKHWYRGTEYCIDELCVHTDKQQQGVGTLFLHHVEDACRSLGLTHLFLLTDRNVPAYRFYKSRGFIEQEGNVAFAREL